MSGNSGNGCKRVIDKNFEKIVQLCQTKFPDYREDKELFAKLLHGDFDLNYKIPCGNTGNTSFETDWMEGCTIFEIVGTDIDRCKALIEHGVDFTVTDKKGSTVLLQNTTDYAYKSYLESIGTSISDDGETSYTNLILSAHISSRNVNNPKDKNGLSHFHVACMYNRADAAKFFLESGVPINETINSDSKFHPGFSALHFAANSCAVETVELLLKLGADMFAQDTKGVNPLHVLIFERRKILIQLQRVLKMPPTNRENWQRTKLQERSNLNLKIIHLFLEKMNELGCTIDNTGFSYFHVLCLLGNASEIQQFLDNNADALGQCVNVNSSIWPGYTSLHFAAHSNVETVELLVKRGADLGIEDTKGLTPFELCLKEFSIADVHRILLLQPDYFNITFLNSKTKLGDFIHAMQDTTTFQYFLYNNLIDPNMFIPLDSPVCAGFTALHLVVVCAEQPMTWDSKSYDIEYILLADMSSEKSQNYLSRIEFCLGYRTDVTSIDARGWSPIHWAFKLQQTDAVSLLLAYHHSNSNPVDEHGLSHLHIACAAKDPIVVEKLLSAGANIHETATSSYTCMNVETADNEWLGDQVKKYFISEGSTPLHFASSVKDHDIVKILIDHNADVLAKDSDGFNALERLFKVPIFLDLDCHKRPGFGVYFNGSERGTVKLLVKSIGDQLADVKPKQMLYCYKLLADNLLCEILSQTDESTTKILESVGITALHVACYTRNLERVIELAHDGNVNARVDLNSPLWPGYTPMYLLMMGCVRREPLRDIPSNRAIMEKLLQSGVDLAITNNKGDTPLHQIFHFYRFTYGDTIKYLKDCSVNPTGKEGYTHLHIASAYGATSIVEKLLEHGADVDCAADYFAEHYAGYTALHLAVFFQRRDVVDLLLKYGANANSRNAEGGNSLHVANFEVRAAPCLELLQTLISAGADINLKDMYGETPLVALLKSRIRTKEEIELFLVPHMRFHTFNLITDEGFLAVALKRREQMPIYDIAINACDVKDIDANGRNAIHNIVSFRRPDWGDLYQMTIDEDAIDDNYTTPEDYIKEIRSLMKLGLNIDQQDGKGSTPLHLAARMQNLTGIIGLLENGADINIKDFDGKPAFAYSFELAKIHEKTNFENNRKELRELDERILKVIVTHIYKLNLTGTAISESTREVGAKMREIQSYDASKIEKCMNEIEDTQEQKINLTAVTFYDFMTDTGAVSNFPYFLLRQKTAMDCAFEKEVEKLREQFPELTGILLWQYRKALARCNVIDSAVSSLKFLVNFNIPPNISKIILRFLNNNELENLINLITLD